jgi:hypothetical protein
MTLLVASGSPTAVVFWPVLISWLASGKNPVTTVKGTIASRGKTAPDAVTLRVPEDGDCSPRTTGTIPTIAINNIANRFIGEAGTGLHFSR